MINSSNVAYSIDYMYWCGHASLKVKSRSSREIGIPDFVAFFSLRALNVIPVWQKDL